MARPESALAQFAAVVPTLTHEDATLKAWADEVTQTITDELNDIRRAVNALREEV